MTRRIIIGAATLACTLFVGGPAKATDFTLSESAIMSLGYNMRDSYTSPPTASIVLKEHIAGVGVRYDIHFDSTNSADSSLFQVSDKKHGAEMLASVNVSAYSNFILQFTVLSIDHSTSGNDPLVVGSVIGPWNCIGQKYGSPYGYKPQVVSLSGIHFSPSGVSTTSVTSNTVNTIGFTVHPVTGTWSAGPHDVTLIVSPARGAVQVSEH